MTFSSRILIGHDKKWFHALTLQDLILYGERPVLTPQDDLENRFAMAGLHDYKQALAITVEWYERTMPVLIFHELAGTTSTDAIDLQYGESNTPEIKFSRSIRLPASIKQDPLKRRWTPEGMVARQNGEIYLSPYHLAQMNYTPGVGDFVIYRAEVYEVTSVQAQPTDYWLQTGIPLHVQIMIKGATLPNDTSCLECLALESPPGLQCDAEGVPAMQQLAPIDPFPASPPGNQSPVAPVSTITPLVSGPLDVGPYDPQDI
jgi:hypothetical protein